MSRTSGQARGDIKGQTEKGRGWRHRHLHRLPLDSTSGGKGTEVRDLRSRWASSSRTARSCPRPNKRRMRISRKDCMIPRRTKQRIRSKASRLVSSQEDPPPPFAFERQSWRVGRTIAPSRKGRGLGRRRRCRPLLLHECPNQFCRSKEDRPDRVRGALPSLAAQQKFERRDELS